MTQFDLPLDGEARARNTDPATSHQAAAQVRGDDATRMEKLVFDCLNEAPHGLTNHELVEATGLTWNTVTPRIRPMVRKGLVMDSGERRPGPTGKRCIVWKVK